MSKHIPDTKKMVTPSKVKTLKKTMNLKQFKAELMKNPKVKAEFERFDLWYELGELWTDIKIKVLSIFKRGRPDY